MRILKSAESAIVFVALVFFLEFFQALSSIRSEPTTLLSILTNQWRGIAPHILGFIFRLLLCYGFFAFILFLLESLFRVRNKLIWYCLVSLYCIFYSLLFSPQLFDEFQALRPLLLWVVGNLDPWMIYANAIAIILFLPYELIRSGKISAIRAIFCLAAIILVGFYFFQLQALPQRGFQPKQAASDFVREVKNSRKLKNIIVLSIDSLRPDHSIFDRNNSSHKNLIEILDKSYQFEHTIATIPRTHPSFTSLFTAKYPQNHGVRYFLSARALNTDDLLKESPLEEFRKAGYEIKFSNDGNKYVFFNEGRIISRSLGAEVGIKNFALPLLLKSRLILGLFNNPIGFLLLPELRGNAAFSNSYKLPYYTEDVISNLRESISQDQPIFFIAHTCALHFPSHLTFPYYPKEGFLTGSPYAYGADSYNNFSEAQFGGNSRAKYNKRIYSLGVELVRDQFILPIIDELKRSGQLENSIIVVMSDHGENFWERDTPTEIRYPEHGSSLIFGADSERSFLSIYLPGKSGGRIKEIVSHIDILPTLSSYLGLQIPENDGRNALDLSYKTPKSDKLAYYTESGIWPFYFFQDQFRTYNANSIASLFLDR